jgi:hypothetical protein
LISPGRCWESLVPQSSPHTVRISTHHDTPPAVNPLPSLLHHVGCRGVLGGRLVSASVPYEVICTDAALCTTKRLMVDTPNGSCSNLETPTLSYSTLNRSAHHVVVANQPPWHNDVWIWLGSTLRKMGGVPGDSHCRLRLDSTGRDVRVVRAAGVGGGGRCLGRACVPRPGGGRPKLTVYGSSGTERGTHQSTQRPRRERTVTRCRNFDHREHRVSRYFAAGPRTIGGAREARPLAVFRPGKWSCGGHGKLVRRMRNSRSYRYIMCRQRI